MIYSELKHQPERSKVYLGSPSIIRLPDGVLVASHDYFGNMKNLKNESGLTSIYRSEDNGRNWVNITYMIGAFWGTLFLYNEALYHISISQEYGHVVIRSSNDGGFTWTVPIDEGKGLLFRAGSARKNPNYHFGGATSVLFHNGRIYKALEDLFALPSGLEWRPDYFHASVISAPLDADLLDASSWTRSNRINFDHKQVNDENLAKEGDGWLEGSPEVAPDGKVKMLMRIHLQRPNKAALLSLSDDGKELYFDYKKGIIDFVGGHSKFTVRRDSLTKKYFMITNHTDDERFSTSRNTLKLAVSDDLRNWEILITLLSDDTGLEPEQSQVFTGFQYPDWQFDGDDIIYLVRTAYRGAHNFHDSNRITYHVLKNFRTLIAKKRDFTYGNN